MNSTYALPSPIFSNEALCTRCILKCCPLPSPAATLLAPGSGSSAAADEHVSTIVQTRGVYWASLCEPAILPLTMDHVLTPAEVASEFTVGFHPIDLPAPSGATAIINTIVGYRLDVDFQLVTADRAVLEACA